MDKIQAETVGTSSPGQNDRDELFHFLGGITIIK